VTIKTEPGALALGELLPEAHLPPESATIAIAGITADSRVVEPGFLFAAMPGVKADGMNFARAAAERGAAVIVTESEPKEDFGIPVIRVPNVRSSLAKIASRFYPQQPKIIAAVTGTNGKTSVASFLRQIWAELDYPAASLGTVGLVSPKGEEYSNLTTPDPIALHRIIDRLAGEGVTHLALEASSHGLDQHRLDGLKLAAGGFTNITRDHLDYHPTFDDYRSAKLKLFSEVLPAKAGAVVSADSDGADAFIAAARARGLKLLTVGAKGTDIHLFASERDGFSQKLHLRYGDEDYRLTLPLAGAFQVENALVAAGLAIVTGGKPDKVFSALENIKGASGRLERVGERNGATVIVDYAHTPDALANALSALRPYAEGRLIALFGAGGDRDPGKRPLMGAVAREKADSVIVTDDNPRSEEPATIRSQILAAAPGAREIGDRGEAIATAVKELKPGDVLLVAGKGHETGQIVKDRVLPFSDYEAIRAALKD
jgi:UDP-N-acetylmuramoyl-L-alanyl-D-glutamate--2,6-diaminopimelate ligase